MVMLFARSSIALGKVWLRHIQDGFVNRSFDIFVNLLLLSLLPLPVPVESIAAAACRHATGPSCPIPIALSPFHLSKRSNQWLSRIGTQSHIHSEQITSRGTLNRGLCSEFSISRRKKYNKKGGLTKLSTKSSHALSPYWRILLEPS